MPRLEEDRNLLISAGERLLPGFDKLIMRYCTIEERPVIASALFPWIPELEASWSVIRDEAQALLEDPMSLPALRDISPDHRRIAVDDKWRSFFLWGYGTKIEGNCARCPETARIVERIPGLLSAFFSVMRAGAHVPRHTGPTKAIMTAHLGLIIPKRRERCHMQVADENVTWEEGRVVVFDDMYPHEVWNDTDEDRVILLVHLKRPLRFPGSAFRDLFFATLRASPFVQDGLKNIERLKQARANAA